MLPDRSVGLLYQRDGRREASATLAGVIGRIHVAVTENHPVAAGFVNRCRGRIGESFCGGWVRIGVGYSRKEPAGKGHEVNHAITVSDTCSYGEGLAGWYFDDACVYYPLNPDFRRLTLAAKAGNLDRVVCYNPWILPRSTDFQDYLCGEDSTVPLFHAQLMTEALKKANVPVELIIVKNAGHGYTFVAPPGGPPAQPSPAEVDAAVLKFLDANLKK